LSPIVVELERTRGPLLVVSHQAVLRIVYGYFMDHAPEVCPRLDIPLHTVIELDVDPSGCRERRHFLGPARDRPYA
jgi:broad specificity phosphatase PhoE